MYILCFSEASDENNWILWALQFGIPRTMADYDWGFPSRQAPKSDAGWFRTF